jgi:hypothetical protein
MFWSAGLSRFMRAEGITPGSPGIFLSFFLPGMSRVEKPWIANQAILKTKELASLALTACRSVIFMTFRGLEALRDKQD